MVSQCFAPDHGRTRWTMRASLRNDRVKGDATTQVISRDSLATNQQSRACCMVGSTTHVAFTSLLRLLPAFIPPQSLVCLTSLYQLYAHKSHKSRRPFCNQRQPAGRRKRPLAYHSLHTTPIVKQRNLADPTLYLQLSTPSNGIPIRCTGARRHPFAAEYWPSKKHPKLARNQVSEHMYRHSRPLP